MIISHILLHDHKMVSVIMILCAKLFALCDRGIDLGDCLALAPTAEEIDDIHPWLDLQDAHTDWPAHVRATLADLAKRLGHDV
jgi:hypothetical protein